MLNQDIKKQTIEFKDQRYKISDEDQALKKMFSALLDSVIEKEIIVCAGPYGWRLNTLSPS